jgi:uncharacterized protein YbjQ (UPF0145 family)
MDQQSHDEFIITSTEIIQGKEIKSYLGIVEGISITGFGALREVFSSWTDIFGGKSGSYEKEFTVAKEKALYDLKTKAQSLSANAIVGVRLDFESISAKGKSFVMVTATGTAVVV